MNNRTLTVIALAIMTLPLSVIAHHSMAIYDTSQEISIEGTVSRVVWRNPHVYIHLSETAENDQIISWEIEGLGPGSLRRIGWTKETLQVGDQLTVVGNPTRNINRRGFYPHTIHRAGRKLFEGREFFELALSAEDATGQETQDLSGNWVTQLNYDLILEFAEGAEHTGLTSAGELAVEQFNEPTMNPGANCAQVPSPFFMVVPDIKNIELQENVIRISGDYDGGERQIFMNLESHDGATFSSHGHSIGRWEEDTLIIDTTHFAEDPMGNGWGLPSGKQKHLIEYLTLNDDRRSLSYRFELADPEFRTTPLTGETVWKYGSDLEFEVDECDLGSARRFIEN